MLFLLLLVGSAILPHTPQSQSVLANQVKLTSYQNAFCLDGTPGAYYILKGSGNPNKWYIHFQGGGWCAAAVSQIGNSPFDSCLNRRQSYRGSTGADPAQYDLNKEGVGPLKTNAQENPQMHDWTHVFVRYCDGGSFSGNTEHNINSIVLHYRGYIILQSTVKDLLSNQGLNYATDVVIGGCSAGGLAMYLHIDEVANMIRQSNSGAKIRGLIDSGFFMMDELPTSQFVKGFQWIYANASAKGSLNQQCIQSNFGSEYKCMFAQYAAAYINTPVFVLQSKYDCWQAIHILESNSSSQLNPYGQNILTNLQKTIWSKSQNGGIVDSCYHHCGEWNAIQCNGGSTQPIAFENWYNSGGSQRCVDKQMYPPTSDCPNDYAGCV